MRMRGPASALLLLLSAGCAGLFQRAAPPRVQSYAVSAEASVLRVGSAERDITPDVGDYLGGFDLARRSVGVGSPLKVRVLVLETPSRRFAVVGVDSLGLMREDVDYLKAAMAGFANGDVFVCSSHTHAGPDPIGIWGYYFLTSGRDRGYLSRLREAVRDATAEARAAAQPARLRYGSAQLPPEGLVRNSNRAGVFDRRVRVLHAVAVDGGRPLGTLLHLACHPEVLRRQNALVSADFVGALCDEWRRRGHRQAVFANGALGAMITPDFSPNDMSGVAAFGAAACDLCEGALAAAAPLLVDRVAVRRADVYLPMKSSAFRLGRLTSTLERELFDGAARSSVGYLRIGAFEAVAVPGEMEPGLAQQVRAELGRPDLVVLGLCDDEVGYLMREQEAVAPLFAYERSMSPCRRAGELVRAALTGVQRNRGL